MRRPDLRDLRDLRDLLGPSLVSLGALGVVVGTFWPWVASGSRNRSSYEVFDVVERLGFAPGGAVGWGLRLWPMVPLLVVAAAVASWYRRRDVAVVLGVLGGLYAGGVGMAVRTGPTSGLVRVLGAPAFTAAAAAVLLVGVAVEAFVEVRTRRRRSA